MLIESKIWPLLLMLRKVINNWNSEKNHGVVRFGDLWVNLTGQKGPAKIKKVKQIYFQK